MGKGLRRAVCRACLVAAGVCALVAFAASPAPAQDDGVPRPEVFRGVASSLAASVQADRDALLPVPELFRFIALDGSGNYESSSQSARASLLFPGNGLILGPSLACGTFGTQFPKQFKPLFDTCLQYKYPLTVFADSFAPDGATSGSLAFGAPNDPVSGNAVRAKAHAGEDATTTDAVIQDLRVLGLPAFGAVTPGIPGFEMDTSLFTVDSATSRTNQRIVSGHLVVDSEATLSGVRMIGGLVRIGSLRSESHVTDDAAGKRTAKATLVTSGVTVGGVPAQITEKGLVLGPSGSSGPLAQQQQAQLNQVLRAFNVKVTVLGSEENPDKHGSAVASVGGILVEFARDAQGLPTVPGPAGELDPNGAYTGSFQLGSTAALGSAASFGSDAAVGPSEAGIDSASGGSDGVASSGGDDVAAAPVIGDSSSSAAAAGRSGASPGSSPAEQALVRSLGGRFGNRIGLVYLSLALAVLGLCIVPRLTVPARFPGPPS